MQRVASIVVLGVIPLTVLSAFVAFAWHRHELALDFHYGLYRQAKGLLNAGVPFDPVNVAITGENRVYTLTATILALPFTALSAAAATVVMSALLIAATIATAAVLGVRDWRVFGVLFLCAPVLSGIQTGNLTLFLALIVALAWRLRHHRFAPGVLVGLACALKVYMWPVAIWLIATRRFASAAISASIGLASILIILPFADPLNYFRLAERDSAVMESRAYSLYALLGGGLGARIAWLLLAAGVLACALRAGDRSSFTLAIMATILFSPIVWLHYFAVLIVPLAIARPRFGPLWLAPLIFWLVPVGSAAPWQIALALCASLGLVAALVAPRPSGRRERESIGLAPVPS